MIMWIQTPHLDPHIVRDFLVLDKPSHELEVCVTSSGIRDLDLFDATLDQLAEE